MLSTILADDTATTYTEYLVATLFLIAAAIGASRLLLDALVRYLRRIFLIVTLPIP